MKIIIKNLIKDMRAERWAAPGTSGRAVSQVIAKF